MISEGPRDTEAGVRMLKIQLCHPMNKLHFDMTTGLLYFWSNKWSLSEL